MYQELIQEDIDAIIREKRNNIKKHSILDIPNNVGVVFTGHYFHYKDVSKETKFERNIAKRAKLRRQRLDEVKKGKKT